MSKEAAEFIDLKMLRTAVTPVSPEDSLAEAGRKILLADFVRMLAQEAGCRLGEDPEYVHHMRVATRRMRSAFRLLGAYYKTKSIQPFLRGLRKLARALGRVRDLDVMLDDLKREPPNPDNEGNEGVQLIIEKLEKRRRRARKKLISYLDSASYQHFLRAYATFLTSPGKSALAVDHDTVSPYQVRHMLPILLHQQLAQVRAYDSVINPNGTASTADAQPEAAEDSAAASPIDEHTLHMLRIEFKRLRYAISYFRDVLGASGEKFIDEIKAIQDHLGKLNDRAVAQARLHELVDELGLDEALLSSYLQKLADEQAALTAAFPAIWARFNTRSVQSQLANALLVLR